MKTARRRGVPRQVGPRARTVPARRWSMTVSRSEGVRLRRMAHEFMTATAPPICPSVL